LLGGCEVQPYHTFLSGRILGWPAQGLYTRKGWRLRHWR
jgi:hypothetical protein